MSLENPLFRQLVRIIIAGILETGKDAYKMLFWKFGQNIKEAARFMWENRNRDPFKQIGGEEVPMATAQSLYQLVKRIATNAYDSEIVNMAKTFVLLNSRTAQMPTDLGKELYTSLQNLQRTFRNVPPIVRNDLMTQRGNLTEEQFYNTINIATKEIQYAQALHNRAFLEKEERQPGSAAPTPVSPTGMLYGKEASVFRNLNIVLAYIDSL
jgi:hypothetical protein